MTALGFTHADVVVVDYDEETHLARMLAANAHSGKNDEDKLDALLASLRDASVDPVLALLSALPPAPPPPPGDADAEPDLDRAAELNKIWQVEPGQVWQIGNHRLMCGSSTEAADVARLLNGAKPRLMITDPPYGIEYDANWRNEAKRADGTTIGASAIGKVQNDDQADWTEAWKLTTAEVAYVWHAGNMTAIVLNSIASAAFVSRALIIWNKNCLVISRGDYHSKHEPCWYAVRKGCTGGWIGDRKQTTVWDIDKPQKSETGHSTQKPLECMARPMRNHSGDVHDPFLGSGTTMLAAQNLHRICYGMEISPDYCAVILDRMHRAFPDLEIKRVA
jgi:DNA modification methylase